MLHQGILGIDQNLFEVFYGEFLHYGNHRQPPYELRDHAELYQVFGRYLVEYVFHVGLDVLILDVVTEQFYADTVFDDFVQSDKCAPANE